MMDEPGAGGLRESSIEPEVYFLICKFLSRGPCQRAAQALRAEIEEHGLMPKRLDWLGKEHNNTFLDLEKSHPHIKDDHLLKICSRIGPILDKEIPPSISGVASLLGAGGQSLLRRKSDAAKHPTIASLSVRINGAPPAPHVKQLPNYPSNLVNVLAARENSGPTSVRHTLKCNVYSKQQMHRRLLGHLSSVYCISFDRTGRYIFTGADDLLVKIWSAEDGRLLSTLRGHSAEITDLAVNYENTLIAAGSCDKMIRVWSLKSTAPVKILTGHTGMVTSVKFCPFTKDHKSYLVSTANDGCVCFWKWDIHTYDFEAKPIKFVERTKPGAQLICSSFSSGGVFLAVGSTDHYVRVYHVNAPNGPEKILEIDAHSDQVDSLQFSNLSCRFLSGSKDGTAHIWWYERQTWKSHLLKMMDRLPGEPPIEESDLKVNKIRVNMVGWTCDDTYVITAVNDHSLKIWESNSGKLRHVLRQHEDDVFVIEAHPTDPRVFLSGGHDGRIILWDIGQGTPIKIFFNQIEGQGHGAIFDCKFSADGQTFASTDSHGHITIYGFGSNECYEKVPTEVFFHTDYRPLIRDCNHYVIDEQTQCPPHLMPPPFLVDIDGNPYPPELQRLVPGREYCNEEQLVPYIAIHNERGVAEVLEPVMRPDGDQPLPPPAPPPPPPVPDLRPTIDDMIQRLQQEQTRQRVSFEHGYAAHPQNDGEASASNRGARRRNQQQSPADNSNSRVGIRRSGDVEGVRQSSGNWQSRDSRGNIPVWDKRPIVEPLDLYSLRKVRRQICEFAANEQAYYNKEKRKKAAPEVSVVRVSKQERFTRRKRRMIQQRQGVVGRMITGPAMVRSITNRRHPGIIDYENPEELLSADDSVSNSGSAADSWAETSSGSESESDDEEEEWDIRNGDESTRNKGKGTGKKRNGNSRRPSDGSDQDDDDDEDGGGDRKEAGNSSEENKSELRNGKKSPSPPLKEPSKKRKGNGKCKKFQEELYYAFKELPPNFHLSEWLSSCVPRRTPYFPQLGDEVVYFKKGHQAYVNSVKQTNAYEFKGHAFFKKKNIKDMMMVKVVDIKYEVKPPRLVVLKCAVIDEATGAAMSETFILRYHDMPDVIDFLVLKQHFDKSMVHYENWQVGARFRSLIDNDWWLGSIENRLQTNVPFQSLEVLWDSKEKEVMSPWDLEPVDAERMPEEGEGLPVLQEELKRLSLYEPKNDDWNECGRDAECDRIARGMESIMQISQAESFIVPVDVNALPVYGMMVAYPMDLTTIKTRLENRFYRRKEALKFDVKFVEENARLFNESKSHIVTCAKMITELCLRFIEAPDSEDPMPIFQEIQEHKEMFEATENEDEDDESDDDVNEEVIRKDGRGGRKRRTTESLDIRRTRANKQLKLERNEITTNTWRKQCRELVQFLFNCEDSHPFRFPVDPILYPDYNTVIDTPMDLTTVTEQLQTGSYDEPTEFKKDMHLIFLNSRNYNPNKRSRIHSMTIRLSALFDEKISSILSDYRSALIHERRLKKKKKSSKSSPQFKLLKVVKQSEKKKAKPKSASTSAQPSTSGYSSKSFSSQASSSRSPRKRVIRDIRDSSEEDATCVKQEPAAVTNGLAKTIDFFRTLVQSDDSDVEESKPERVGDTNDEEALHSDSDTEIDEADKRDSDATEIEENGSEDKQPLLRESFKRKRRKSPKLSISRRKSNEGKSPKRKKLRRSESASSEYSEYSSECDSLGSCSESSTLVSEDDVSDEEVDDEEEEEEIYGRTRRRSHESRGFDSGRSSGSIGRCHQKGRNTRNGGIRKVNYDEADSDYDYGVVKKEAAVSVSSRGRIRKPKGHAKAGLMH